MDYLRIRRGKEQKIRGGISIFMTLILCFLLFPSRTNGISESKDLKINMVYIQIINYVLPVVKINSFDGDDLAENENSIKDSILEYMGLNIKKPLSILEREISAFKRQLNKEGKTGTEENMEFDLFQLQEGEIAKNPLEPLDSKTQNEDLNLPNQIAPFYDPKLKKNINIAKPEVFIYHTHTSESYLSNLNQLAGVLKDKKDVCDTDTTKNVCAVGDALKEELEKRYGIAVIHDKTVHDAVAYTQSYARSSVTMDKYFKKYGDFKIVIDLHRDSVESRAANIVKINGENVAKVMFVMAKNNPHFNENMEVVNKMMSISNKLFPGFARDPYYYNRGTSFFNQGKSNNAVLIEVGSHINTTEEATNSAKYLGRIISEYLNGKN